MQRIAQRSALGLCIAAGIGGVLLRAAAVFAQPGAQRRRAERRQRQPAACAPRRAYRPHAPSEPASCPPPRRPAARRSPRAEARGSAACIAGASEGIPRGDAHTAAALVCQALRDNGADVSAEPVDPRPRPAAARPIASTFDRSARSCSCR